MCEVMRQGCAKVECTDETDFWPALIRYEYYVPVQYVFPRNYSLLNILHFRSQMI